MPGDAVTVVIYTPPKVRALVAALPALAPGCRIAEETADAALSFAEETAQ